MFILWVSVDEGSSSLDKARGSSAGTTLSVTLVTENGPPVSTETDVGRSSATVNSGKDVRVVAGSLVAFAISNLIT